jgi:hypothetical protein
MNIFVGCEIFIDDSAQKRAEDGIQDDVNRVQECLRRCRQFSTPKSRFLTDWTDHDGAERRDMTMA